MAMDILLVVPDLTQAIAEVLAQMDDIRFREALVRGVSEGVAASEIYVAARRAER